MTIAEMNTAARYWNINLKFETVDTRYQDHEMPSGETETIPMTEVQGYADDRAYGIWGLVSPDTEVAPHRWSVVHAEDGQSVRNDDFKDLEDALHYILRTEERDAQENA